MPFKIVKTFEKGKTQLSVVPSHWESKGLLRWPSKKCTQRSKLIRDENSIPLVDWLTINCAVKRTSINSYSRAEEEINMMTQHSDTETDVTDIEMRNIDTSIDHNDMATNLVLHSNIEPQELTSTTSKSVSGQTSKDIIQIINADGTIMSTAVNSEQALDIDKLFLNQKQIMENQVTIMQNQSIIHETQKSMVEQEKKNFHQLQNLSVQLEYYFERYNSQSSNVVLLSEVANTNDNTSFILKPMHNIKELQDLEDKIANKKQRNEIKQKYLLLCSKHEGTGTNCAYKLLDILFAKEFLCQFSWSGGSRTANVVKIALKGYKRFLRFFFEIINYWDPLYTQTDGEDFFKTVLKNSAKRLQTKNLRTSTKRNRQKKISNKKQKTTIETMGDDNVNEDVSCADNKNKEVCNEPNVKEVETDKRHEEFEKDISTDTGEEIENRNKENTENTNNEDEEETTSHTTIYKETPV